MKKQERLIKEPQAFALYTEGIALDKIAKQIGIAFKTTRNWKKEYKWDKRKKEINQRLQDQQKQAIINFNKKKIPLIMNLIAKTIKDIQLSDKGNVKDFMMLYEKFEQLTQREEAFPEEVEKEIEGRAYWKALNIARAMSKGLPYDKDKDIVIKSAEELRQIIKGDKEEKKLSLCHNCGSKKINRKKRVCMDCGTLVDEEKEEEVEEEEELEDMPEVKKKKKTQPEPFDEDLEGNQEKEPVYGYIATGK